MTEPDELGAIQRRCLWIAGATLAVVAFTLPVLHGGPTTELQLLAGAVGVAATLASPWFPSLLGIAAGLLVTTAALAVPETSFPLPTLAVSGVVALAAFEAMALHGLWIGDGTRGRAVETAHLAVSARRCALGAAGAAAVMLIGVVELPAPGVIATVGVLAAAIAIAVTTARPA